MKEQLISFETAKLAKEKGFNIPCKNTYLVNGSFVNDSFEDEIFYQGALYIIAPTQALLQRWLREVHGIHLESSLTMGLRYSFRIYKGLDDKGFTDVDTYEEALEAGLQEALKLITLKKNL